MLSLLSFANVIIKKLGHAKHLKNIKLEEEMKNRKQLGWSIKFKGRR